MHCHWKPFCSCVINDQVIVTQFYFCFCLFCWFDSRQLGIWWIREWWSSISIMNKFVFFVEWISFWWQKMCVVSSCCKDIQRDWNCAKVFSWVIFPFSFQPLLWRREQFLIELFCVGVFLLHCGKYPNILLNIAKESKE